MPPGSHFAYRMILAGDAAQLVVLLQSKDIDVVIGVDLYVRVAMPEVEAVARYPLACAAQ